MKNLKWCFALVFSVMSIVCADLPDPNESYSEQEIVDQCESLINEIEYVEQAYAANLADIQNQMDSLDDVIDNAVEEIDNIQALIDADPNGPDVAGYQYAIDNLVQQIASDQAQAQTLSDQKQTLIQAHEAQMASLAEELNAWGVLLNSALANINNLIANLQEDLVEAREWEELAYDQWQNVTQPYLNQCEDDVATAEYGYSIAQSNGNQAEIDMAYAFLQSAIEARDDALEDNNNAAVTWEQQYDNVQSLEQQLVSAGQIKEMLEVMLNNL